MRRLKSSLIWRLGMLMTVLFILVSCTEGFEASSIKIQESAERNLQGMVETIRINNCTGETTAQQKIQQLHEIVISNVGSEQDIQHIKDTVASQYADDYGTSREVSLMVPPGTHKEFVIAWMIEVLSGTVAVNEDFKLATYVIRISFGVGVVSTLDLVC